MVIARAGQALWHSLQAIRRKCWLGKIVLLSIKDLSSPVGHLLKACPPLNHELLIGWATKYNLDMTECIYCGFCQENCPSLCYCVEVKIA